MSEDSGQPYRCPVCGAVLCAGAVMPSHNPPCSCGHDLWCRMRTVRGVAVLDLLPDKVPCDVDQIADSLAGFKDAPRAAINMSSVDLVSSLFLARLLQLHKRIQKNYGTLILFSLQPLTREIIDSTRLDRVFDVADDEEAALASF